MIMKFIYILIITFCFISAQDCSIGYTEINNLCFHQGDLGVIQKFIDNSYASNIDLGCVEGDAYCGSPNPYMDDPESWFWKIIDGQEYTFTNGDGIVDPLELGIQEWENGRLKSIMCGAYIYCQLSGSFPEEINTLSELSSLRLELNYLTGFIPHTLCDLSLNENDNIQFDISANMLCPPYPECIIEESDFWYQDTLECTDIGDINQDFMINIQDIILLVNVIINGNDLNYQEMIANDINADNQLDILDIIQLLTTILN